VAARGDIVGHDIADEVLSGLADRARVWRHSPDFLHFEWVFGHGLHDAAALVHVTSPLTGRHRGRIVQASAAPRAASPGKAGNFDPISGGCDDCPAVSPRLCAE
jgi:hypothetical protein